MKVVPRSPEQPPHRRKGGKETQRDQKLRTNITTAVKMSRLDNIEKPTMIWRWRSLEDIRAASWFTLGNYANVILLAVFLLVAINQIRLKSKEAKKAGYEKRYLKASEFPEIEEQPDFDWKSTEPLQLRPFRPKYHLTMGESAN